MGKLGRLLGYYDKKYRGDGFSVRVDSKSREGVAVVYERGGAHYEILGERIGPKWRSLTVRIPPRVDHSEAKQIAANLAVAFTAMGYFGYIVDQVVAIEAVPDEEQRTARAELEAMGFVVTASPDKPSVHLRLLSGSARPDARAMRSNGPRMMDLVQAVRGVRSRTEVLAKSPEI